MYSKNDNNIYEQIMNETIESVKTIIKNSQDLFDENLQNKIINRIEDNFILEKNEIIKMADLTKYQYEIREKKKSRFKSDFKSYFGLDYNFKDYLF